MNIHKILSQMECNPEGLITKCFLLLMEGDIPMASKEMKLLKETFKDQGMHPLGVMA